MKTRANNRQEHKSRAVANAFSRKQGSGDSSINSVENQSSGITQIVQRAPEPLPDTPTVDDAEKAPQGGVPDPTQINLHRWKSLIETRRAVHHNPLVAIALLPDGAKKKAMLDAIKAPQAEDPTFIEKKMREEIGKSILVPKKKKENIFRRMVLFLKKHILKKRPGWSLSLTGEDTANTSSDRSLTEAVNQYIASLGDQKDPAKMNQLLRAGGALIAWTTDAGCDITGTARGGNKDGLQAAHDIFTAANEVNSIGKRSDADMLYRTDMDLEKTASAYGHTFEIKAGENNYTISMLLEAIPIATGTDLHGSRTAAFNYNKKYKGAGEAQEDYEKRFTTSMTYPGSEITNVTDLKNISRYGKEAETLITPKDADSGGTVKMHIPVAAVKAAGLSTDELVSQLLYGYGEGLEKKGRIGSSSLADAELTRHIDKYSREPNPDPNVSSLLVVLPMTGKLDQPKKRWMPKLRAWRQHNPHA